MGDAVSIKQPETVDRYGEFVGGVLTLLAIAMLVGFGFLVTP